MRSTLLLVGEFLKKKRSSGNEMDCYAALLYPAARPAPVVLAQGRSNAFPEHQCAAMGSAGDG